MSVFSLPSVVPQNHSACVIFFIFVFVLFFSMFAENPSVSYNNQVRTAYNRDHKVGLVGSKCYAI